MIGKECKELFDVRLHSNTGDFELSSLKNKYVVLFFYPKDNTPGCTVESIEFNSLLYEFNRADTVVIGVSRDSLASHDKFCSKHGLNFRLVSDKDDYLCEYFNVISRINFFGKQISSLERSTFLLDLQTKTILQEWKKVKYRGHAQDILNYILALS